MIIKAIDFLKNLHRVSILDTIKLLTYSREDVTNNTIQKCFAKAKISNYNELRAQADLDDPFTELRNSTEQLKEMNSAEILRDISPEEFDSLDDSQVANEAVLSDELNTDMMRQGAYEECESDGDDENPDVEVAVEKPMTVAVRNAEEILMNFSLFSFLDKIRSSAVEISNLIKALFSILLNNVKQVSNTDFLRK